MNSLFPPYDYLNQILEHCPRAGSIYLMLWKDKNDKNRVFYFKKDITDVHFIEWKRFKTDLVKLQKEKVLEFSFNSTQEEVTIYLKVPQDNAKAA